MDAQAFAKHPTLTLKSPMIVWLLMLLRYFNHINYVAPSLWIFECSSDDLPPTSSLFVVLCFKRAIAPHSVRGATLQRCCWGTEGWVLEEAKHSTNLLLVIFFFQRVCKCNVTMVSHLGIKYFYGVLLVGILCSQGAISARWLTSSVWHLPVLCWELVHHSANALSGLSIPLLYA